VQDIDCLLDFFQVVSCSRTPGHTKHFQTIYLTPTICLCDCPGLVFPSLVEKNLQVLSGMFPISQVREPYTPVGYLAARIPLVQLLGLSRKDDDQTQPWSAWDICVGKVNTVQQACIHQWMKSRW
jgi:ribosome biogenesis GTPase A